MSPLVSIIIPAYNAAPWLDACLRSALAQTGSACEIIVIDDGSTDDTRALAQTFLSPQVHIIAQSNRGAAAARNAGLRAAQGEYIQFLDADDLLAPDKITQQLRLLLPLGPRMIASGSWARFEDTPASSVFTPHANWRDLTGVEFLQLAYEETIMMHPAAWLAPRALLDQAGPWNETLSLNDDGEYFARVALTSERIVFCSDAKSYYRSQLAASLSHRKDPLALTSLYRSIELTLAHLLAADRSPRTLAAAAYAWKWTAFELYPGAPDLSQAALAAANNLGGSTRPFPGSRRFQLFSHLLGWRLARRLLA